MIRLAASLLTILAGGCAAVPPPEATTEKPAEIVPPIGNGTDAAVCDAVPARQLVGRVRSAELGAEALRLSRARNLRWIPPGTAVTMDYRPDRLNIELDAQGRITRIGCG